MAIERDRDGYHHPSTEGEIIALVKHANSTGVALRVRGSGRSVDAAIYASDPERTPVSRDAAINVMLDRLWR